MTGVFTTALFLLGLAAPISNEPDVPGMRYDPATVVTVIGVVESVHAIDNPRRRGEHAMVKTADALVEVHLGPRPFLERIGLKLERGVSVTVTGSSVQVAGKPELIARIVLVGAHAFVLRDEKGVPVWSTEKR